MIKPYEITTLKPGFLVITYDQDRISPSDLKMPPEMCEELKKKGYWGGIIYPEGVTLQTVTDEELKVLGLMRIPS